MKKAYDAFGKFWSKFKDDKQHIYQLPKYQDNDYIVADKTHKLNFNFNFCLDRLTLPITFQETPQERKTDLASITNFNFLLDDCHVQGCGPCLGSDVSGGIVGVCVGIGPGVVLMLVHVVVSVLVSTLLGNTLILSLRMRQQQLHGSFSPQQGCQRIARTHWLDPRIRLRRGHHHHHPNPRWHKEHCQPLQLADSSLAKEVCRSPPPSTAVGWHQQCKRPPGCENVSCEEKETYLMQFLCIQPCLIMCQN